MRFMMMLAILNSLLFAYQKGEMISPQMHEKLQLEKNKIYVIDFFASWCASCKQELPLIAELSTKLDKNKVEVIGIDVDEDIQKAQSFQNDLQLPFSVTNDPKGEIIKIFNPIGLPAIYIIKNDKVENLILGAKDDIDDIIEKNIKIVE